MKYFYMLCLLAGIGNIIFSITTPVETIHATVGWVAATCFFIHLFIEEMAR